jgi:hypothetical protein
MAEHAEHIMKDQNLSRSTAASTNANGWDF